MSFFARRADLLFALREAGNTFLMACRSGFSERNRQSDDNFRFCQVVPDEKFSTLISDLIDVRAGQKHVRVINEPFYTWNGSIREPIIVNADNRLVNTSECFPPSLIVLALDYVEKGYGDGTTVYDQFVKKAGALFLCEATPRDFQIDASRQGIGLYFRDPNQTLEDAHCHVAKGKLLYDLIKDGNFPGLDVHDIAHHVSQLGVYGSFYRWLAAHATTDVMSSAGNFRKKRLLRLALLTTLEHAVVMQKEGVQSFGCLNWQSPRKSVLKKGVSSGPEFRVNDYCFGAQDINLWSAIRAIASIYREQIEVEEVLGTQLDWMEVLGYGLDEELLAFVRPFQSYDFSVLMFDAARKATLTVPESPEALFANCRRLIEREFDDGKQSLFQEDNHLTVVRAEAH